ncbi:MAG: 3-isopropylmalate dehydrogenase [SAR202 cluster bacterium]|nr:3-isopropylmalate dehydrogenase [SAR202 cluster bacterium]
MKCTIAVLPGDGVGPEVIAEAVKVLEAVGRKFKHTFEAKLGRIGGNAIDDFGTPLPDATLALAKSSDAILFGAVGGPKWDSTTAKVRPEEGILGIRKGIGLFANIRPVKAYPQLLNSSPLKTDIVRGVDMIILRELTGGLYFGKPKKRWDTSRGRRAVDTMSYSEKEINRILRVGFELARGRRKKLTSVDKFNVLATGRLWRELATEMGMEYPDVELEHVLVDNAAMQLVRNPGRFDVVVAENTFGDILSDEAAMLGGSMGMLPSASLSSLPAAGKRARGVGLYEPIHGTAPDIAGKGVANPIAAILSAAMMLRYSFGLEREAGAVERAVEGVLAEGYRTADIATKGEQTASTTRMGSIIAGNV